MATKSTYIYNNSLGKKSHISSTVEVNNAQHLKMDARVVQRCSLD